jgi:1-deoxy-D-xylulose-5-phosphate synthase
MTQLSRIKSPGDLARFSQEELTELASEIRAFLIEKVSKSGGHLGPNLGIVELSIALHRVFESPQDVMVYDTGHQSYVHKILTGRAADSLNRSAIGIYSTFKACRDSARYWNHLTEHQPSISWLGFVKC